MFFTRDTSTTRSPRTSTRESSGIALKCQTVHCNKDAVQTNIQLKAFKKSVLLCISRHIVVQKMNVPQFNPLPASVNLGCSSCFSGASKVDLIVTNLPANAGDIREMHLIPGSGRSLEEEMATHFSILAWRIPWTMEPRGLWSVGSKRVGHNWKRLSVQLFLFYQPQSKKILVLTKASLWFLSFLLVFFKT